MSEGQVWTVDFMAEEALQLAAGFSPAEESFQALLRAAHALQDAAVAIRRRQAREAVGAGVLGVVTGDGSVRLYRR